MRCTNCGSDLPDGAVFCSECGTRQPDVSDEARTREPPILDDPPPPAEPRSRFQRPGRPGMPASPPPPREDASTSQEFLVAPGRSGRVSREPAPAAAGDPTPRSRREANRQVALGLLAALIAIGALAYFFLLRPEDEVATPPVATDAPATVVATAAPAAPTTERPPPSIPAGAQFDDKDCTDFESPQDAQNFYRESGGPQQDLHGLDPNGNGTACDEQATASTPAP